ncbi:MAG TPA: exonuclease domain-containing protein [Chlamydiales bacterium]|nr:exonuclease domain-containing protein [Chlamydiales bacterium]
MGSIFFRLSTGASQKAFRKARSESFLELDKCIDTLRPSIASFATNIDKPKRTVVKITPTEQETTAPLQIAQSILKSENQESKPSLSPLPAPLLPEIRYTKKSAPNLQNPCPKANTLISRTGEKKTPPPLPHLQQKQPPENKKPVTVAPQEIERKESPLPAGMISLFSSDTPEVVFLAFSKKIGEIIQQTIERNASYGTPPEQTEIIYLERPVDLSKWSPKNRVRTIVLAIDNEGFNIDKNKEIYSVISALLRKKISLKIALPRTEHSHEKRSFGDLFDQKKGASRCAKSLKSACLIEDAEELSNLHLPMQMILQKIAEKRELSQNGIPSKESIEQRKNAAIGIYEKGEIVDPDNIVAVNLQLRGISYIPTNFRAAMLLHPDRTEHENNCSLQSKDQKTGILSALQKEPSLEGKVVFYDNQYWTISSDQRWDSKQDTQPLLVTLRLTNPKKSLLIQICNKNTYVDHQKIESPERSIIVRDFKLFTRVIPYYNEKGVLSGIERTFLGNNAKQPSKQKWKTKLARGVTSGASTSFFGSKTPTIKILGEGSENVLSALEVARTYPEELKSLGIVVHEDQEKCNCQFTAALGVSDLVKVPIQESVRTIVLITDIDGYNMETKQTIIDTVDAFLSRGLNVKILFAPAKILGQKRDFNDVLREEGLKPAKDIFLNLIEITAKEDLGPANEILQLSLTAKKLKTKLIDAPFERRPELLYSLGEVYFHLGRLNQSLECFSQALEGTTKDLQVKIQYMLGSIWLKKKNPERAIDYFTKSLAGKIELKFDSENLEVLSCLEGIGMSYAEQKAYEAAITYLNKSFDAKVRLWKSDEHVGLGHLFYEFGKLDFAQQNWSKALFYFKRALQLKTKEFGSRNHPMVAEILEKIGDIYFAQKQYNEAVEYYKNSIEILNKLFSSDRHCLDADICMKIAKAYYHLNLISEALGFFRKSLSQGKTTFSIVLQQLLRRAHQLEQGKESENPPVNANVDHIQIPLPNLGSNLSTALKINMLKERALNTRQVVLDLEMTGTGLKTDRITEIGCVVVTHLKRTDETFQRYVNPECRVRPEAHRLTGLTHRFLSRFPTFNEVALDFLKFIQDSDLIIHAANNDIQFLTEELKATGIEYDFRKKHQIIDTLDIAKLLFPDKKNSLDALNLRLNINQKRTKHGALLDAEITAEAYLSMLSIETLIT